MHILLLLLLSSLGLFPAFVAYHKGHSFALWWVYGAVVFVIALPRALQTGSKNSLITLHPSRDGPYCRESVPLEDEICPACHLRLYDPALHGPPIENRMPHWDA